MPPQDPFNSRVVSKEATDPKVPGPLVRAPGGNGSSELGVRGFAGEL